MNTLSIKFRTNITINWQILICLLLMSYNSFSQISNEIKENHISKISKFELKLNSGINAIFKDSKGNYWFGSNNQGVALFDGSKLLYFTVKDGLSDNQIWSIQEDTNGNIWFDTASGVSSYNPNASEGFLYPINSNSARKITNHTPGYNKTNHKNPTGKWAKSNNDLWFIASGKSGVYRYNGINVDYLALPKTKIINRNNVYHTTGISDDKNGMLWIATYAGLFGYYGDNFTVINDETLNLTTETGELHIRSILFDSKGNLWVGNNGIGILLIKGDKIINFSEKMGLVPVNSKRGGSLSPPGSLEHVFIIEEDRHGNIWFADRDTGVWKYDGKIIINYSIDDKLPHSELFTRAIYQDPNGDLLFGTVKGSVYKFNGQSFERIN